MKKLISFLFFFVLTSISVYALSVTNITVSSSNGNSIFLNNTITLNAINTTSTNISLDGIDTYNARIDNKNAGITYIYIFNISSTYNKIRYNGDSATDATLTSGSIITLQAAPYYIQISNFTASNNGGSGSSGSSGGGGGGSGSGSLSTTLSTDYEATLSEKTPLAFTLASSGAKHKITINDIQSDRVTLTVSSTPQQAEIALGDTKEFDLNDDNTADVAITVLDIVRTKVTLRIVSLERTAPPELIFSHPTKTDYEELPPEAPPLVTGNTVASPSPLKKFRAYIPWVLMLLIAGLLIYGYNFINKTRRNN